MYDYTLVTLYNIFVYRVSFASAIHNNAWQHFLTWTHPLLQIFETLLVQNFNKLWLKILVTIPCPTGDWAVRLQVVQHVHFLLGSLSIKSNITCQQGFCFKLPKKKTPKTRYCKNVCINVSMVHISLHRYQQGGN